MSGKKLKEKFEGKNVKKKIKEKNGMIGSLSRFPTKLNPNTQAHRFKCAVNNA